MQEAAQLESETKRKIPWNGVERRRVINVVETLAALRSRGSNLAEVAHDARNMVAALGLYCDLLEEPGVLAVPFLHYAQELRLVAAASRCLVEKLVALDTGAGKGSFAGNVQEIDAGGTSGLEVREVRSLAGAGARTLGYRSMLNGSGAAQRHASPAPVARQEPSSRWDLLPALPIRNLAADLMANRNLLSALAGPAIALTMEADGGALPVRITGEDLTRLLVNLVKNAAEAMPAGGRIHIGLSERGSDNGVAACLALTVADNGPGIPDEALEAIFDSGYSTRKPNRQSWADGWPQSHRGLGLAIARAIVEGAGGRITASNQKQGGACFTLELPVRNTGSREGEL